MDCVDKIFAGCVTAWLLALRLQLHAPVINAKRDQRRGVFPRGKSSKSSKSFRESFRKAVQPQTSSERGADSSNGHVNANCLKNKDLKSFQRSQLHTVYPGTGAQCITLNCLPPQVGPASSLPTGRKGSAVLLHVAQAMQTARQTRPVKQKPNSWCVGTLSLHELPFHPFSQNRADKFLLCDARFSNHAQHVPPLS